MGFLNWFKSSKPAVHKLPSGTFTVDRHGKVSPGTMGSSTSMAVLNEIAKEVLVIFKEARAQQMPLTEVNLDFAGLSINARDMQGGAIVFLTPKNPLATASPAGAQS